MIDVQSQRDHRKVLLKKAGVKDIRYPITVLDKVKGQQHTTARVNMYVDLPHQFKGTHMSRFVEILNRYRDGVSIRSFKEILGAMRQRLAAQSAHLEMSFPYFIEKRAPVSRIPSLMEYRCTFSGSSGPGEEEDFVVGILIPINTVCPCSKAISDYGAHNQRGQVSVEVRFRHFFWMEDLIAKVEERAVNQVYALLKRSDEKYVTELAYDHPMFVEDVVREVYGALEEDENFTWFTVGCENFESLHNHSAYAFTEFSRTLAKRAKVPKAMAQRNGRGDDRIG
jgi:GTP cyclohydrolase I